jgi:uncharacterized protein (DUF427 family)
VLNVFFTPSEDEAAWARERTETPESTVSAASRGAAAARAETDLIWSYENPYPSVAELAGRVAFYPNRSEITVG